MNSRLAAFLLLALAAPAFAAEPPAAGAAIAPSRPKSNRWVFSLLPKSMQRKPSLDFHVITELTAEGRKLTPPTSQQPDFYVEQPGRFTQMGMNPPANEKPPPIADLERAMQKALAAGGYLTAPAGKAPHLVVVFNFGSFDRFANDFDEFEQEAAAQDAYQAALASAKPGDPPPPAPQPQLPNDGAVQLLPFILADIVKRKDVIERASMIGGARFAAQLARAIEAEIVYRSGPPSPVPPDEDIGSPFNRFANGNETNLELVEESFSSCYFVVASAYDYTAMTKGKGVLLWRTKMTVNSLGISMTESLAPLIATAGPYLGRAMTETATITHRISRDGHVEIGTPVVVEDPALSASTPNPPQKNPAAPASKPAAPH